MADRAKLFRTGGSQAVRLPRKYRFEGESAVLIRREGRSVVLESEKSGWTRRFLRLAGSCPDLESPPEPPPAEAGPDLDRRR